MIGRALITMGVLALGEGDHARAQALWEEALAATRGLGAPGTTAVICGHLGRAALWQGDTERAEVQYEAVRTMAQRHDEPRILAEALMGLGRVALVRGVHARATALGVGHNCWGRPRPAASGRSAAPIEREAEVAELIVRGLTNRQIGAELSISERTVERHVANSLIKLGLVSRAQIAAWFVERRHRTSTIGGA